MNKILRLLIARNEKSTYRNDLVDALKENKSQKQIEIINYLNWLN